MLPRTPLVRLTFASLFVGLLTACGSPTVSASAASSAPGAHVTAWSYHGAAGPEHWGDLDESFALCSHGAKQSPIDLPLVGEDPGQHVLASMHWDPVPLSIRNTGHTVQVDDPAASSVVIDGLSYSLVQLHFHAPADHTIQGRTFDAELHLVHRSAEGKLAAIAYLLQKGSENAVLHPMLASLPLEAGAAVVVPGVTLNLDGLLPRQPHFLSYEGSLTAPPCTEGIRWLVSPTPLQISEADLEKLRAAVHSPTNRPLQRTQVSVIDLRPH